MALASFITLNEPVATLNQRCVVFWKLDALCTCWSYTAKYKNSNRFFRINGGGTFPKSFRVPGNVDQGTGCMIDEGEFIVPNSYKILD